MYPHVRHHYLYIHQTTTSFEDTFAQIFGYVNDINKEASQIHLFCCRLFEKKKSDIFTIS